MNIRKTVLTGGLAAALAGGGVLALTAAAEATAPPGHKVTICHATASTTNPYVIETVDIASIESFVSGSGHGSSGVNVGDIIPPFTYAPDNFTFAGLGDQSILANGCRVAAAPTPTPTLAPSSTPTVEPSATPTVAPSSTPTVTPSSTPPPASVASPTPSATVSSSPSPSTAPGAPATAPNNSTPTGGVDATASTATGEPLADTGLNNTAFLIGILLLALGLLVMAGAAIRVRRSA